MDHISEAQLHGYHEEQHQIYSADGTRLHAHYWGPSGLHPTRVMVIVHGMGGHGAYYRSSLAPYLAPRGVATYAADLRGHGLSDGPRGHIETFAELEQDVAATVRFARKRHPDLPFFLLGESMGTPLAIVHAATSPKELQPDFLVLAACVIAPTVKPRIDEVFRTPFYYLTNRRKVAIPITGREEQGVRDPDFVRVLKTDELFNRYISVRFLLSMTSTMNRAARLHTNLTMPTLILQGGKDITIRHKPTREFFKRIAATEKEMHVYPDAYHAILNDPDSPLVRARLLDWMERQHSRYFSRLKAS
jgi:alpha-beta hydrolase superfamily lysophospholipase